MATLDNIGGCLRKHSRQTRLRRSVGSSQPQSGLAASSNTTATASTNNEQFSWSFPYHTRQISLLCVCACLCVCLERRESNEKRGERREERGERGEERRRERGETELTMYLPVHIGKMERKIQASKPFPGIYTQRHRTLFLLSFSFSASPPHPLFACIHTYCGVYLHVVNAVTELATNAHDSSFLCERFSNSRRASNPLLQTCSMYLKEGTMRGGCTKTREKNKDAESPMVGSR